MYRKTIFVSTAVAVCLAALPAAAQDKAADDMQIVRDALRAEKKLFVSDNLGLTESEAKAFWPIYDEFQKVLAAANDRTLKLIESYAKNYGAMTDEVAGKLLDELLVIKGEQQKTRESYLPKFKSALPARKVARYYQLENKIEAVINYDLARQIPLVR